MASLVLRDAVQSIDVALQDKSTGRQASLVGAVGKSAAAIRAISDSERIRAVDFEAVSHEVGGLVVGVKRLEAALASEGLGALKDELDTELVQLARTAEGAGDTGVAKMIRTRVVANPQPVVAVTSSERMELCRQAIAGARQAAATFRRDKPGNDREAAIALCIPIPQQLATATDAALSVTDRSERMKLKSDVEGLSLDLDDVAQLLSMPPKLKWDLVFAQTFDGEEQLRHAIGIDKNLAKGSVARLRPYSGTIDPDHAIEVVSGVAHGSSTPASSATSNDPQVAVEKISLGLGEVFKQQISAVDNLKSDLQEPPPPKDSSAFDIILDIAVNVALNAAAGAIGGALADRLKRAFDGSAKNAASATANVLGHLSGDARQQVMDRMVRSGSVYRAAAVDGAKDAVKQFFRDGMRATVLAHHGAGSNASVPLNAFIQRQTKVLDAARHQSGLMMIDLAKALGQVDLETLNRLSTQLNDDMPTEAYDLQYDSSMREWQNLKAHLGAKAIARVGPDVKPSRDVEVPFRHVDGILEVRFVVDAYQPRKGRSSSRWRYAARKLAPRVTSNSIPGGSTRSV
jgi:hypothetical protein